MKRTLLVFVLVAFGCTKDDPTTPTNPNPSPSPTPPPAATTFTLTGRVTESAPTTSIGIAGARVAFNDGPNAGRSAAADSNGNYSFSGLTTGNANPNASAANYLDQARGLALTANATLNFTLMPTPRTLDENLTGSVSGGSPPCGTFLPNPCVTRTIPLHHPGIIDATLTWNGTADLDLELWRGTTEIASSDGVRGTERITADVTGGSNYEFRVIYYQGATIANYILRVIHPN
jgi:hypothetical protein